MKKSFYHILLAGLTVVSAAVAGNAQTLTQDWKSTEGLPTGANARWGTGHASKVYTNDKSVPQIYSWESSATATSLEVGGGKGVGIASDSAGNLVIVNGFASAASMQSLKIYNATTKALTEVAITLPDGVTAARMDITGRAVGDVTSEKGGAIFLCGQNGTKIAKIFIANGVQVADKSKAIDFGTTVDNITVAQPLTDDPESDAIAVRIRGQKDFYYNDNGTWKKYTNLGAATGSGGDVVTLNGDIYTIEPTDGYKDGFQIVNRTTNEVVATHASEGAENKTSFGTALTAEKVDEYTANIYQYHPGSFAAKYTFSIPKPLEARNAYAYDIKVAEADGGNYTVTYRLNAPATAVKVQMLANGEVAKEYDGTTIAEYADREMTTINNLNTVTIPLADIPRDKHISFTVIATSDVVAEPTVNELYHKFYHPQGVEVDNNPESPNFGRILVTEATPVTKEGYLSTGEGQGIYAFDPTITSIKNSAGTLAFKGGQTFMSKFANSKTAYEPRKVRLSADGRLFISAQNTNGVALWEANPLDLNASFTAVVKGTSNADTYAIEDANGNFVAAPNVSFDVMGEGEDLKVLMLSANKTGIAYVSSGFRTDEYNLGEATTWETAPSKAIAGLSGKYAVTYTNTSVIYDNEGGIWFASSRSTAKDTEPTLVHINAEGVEDYKVNDNTLGGFYGGSGIRFNTDFTLLAIGTTGKTITVYEVSKDDNGAPILTEKYKFSSTIGTNCNDIAWDCANNLYFVGNSGEFFKTAALPRESGDVAVESSSDYDFILSSDEYPAELLMIGSAYNWDPEVGQVMIKEPNGIYKTTVSGPSNFSFTTVLDESWDVVNANRYGFSQADDNKVIALNTSTSLVKGPGAIKLEAEGTFDVTVDLKNMTVIVEGEETIVYPKKLYLIGTVDQGDFWNPATDTHVANQTTDGVYTIEDAVIYPAGDDTEYGYFAFIETPDADWTVVNAKRYGPETGDAELLDKILTPIKRNENAYKIHEGVYDITVDLENGTIYAVYKTSGVEDATVATAKVVGDKGSIRIIGEANAVSIYNTAGQAIAVNSKDNEFAVSAGIYVVVVDGKVTKVLVK